MDGLIPYATSLTADGGSHRWIFKLSPEGKAEWALLLILKNFLNRDEEREAKAFLETYEDGWKIRTPLTTDETLARLEQIRNSISEMGHLEKYEYFYDGGRMESDLGSESDDPFETELKDGRTQDEIEAGIAKETNDFTLFNIANWAQYFRLGNGLPLYEFSDDSVGSVINLGEVREVMVFDGNYEPQKRAPRQLNTRFEIGEVVREIGFQNNDGKLPLVFTPHFAVLVLFGEDGEVVSIISVQTANSYCVARAGKQDENGRYIIDYDSIQAEFHSPQLSELLYESFSRYDPGYLNEMREFFKGSPKTLEELVLGKSRKRE